MSRKNIFHELFSEIDIPKELEPENIAEMLREKSGGKAVQKIETEKTDEMFRSDFDAVITDGLLDNTDTETEQKKEKKTQPTGIKTSPTAMIARITVAAAACIAVAVGVSLYNSHNRAGIEPMSVNVSSASRYNDLYNAIEKYRLENPNGNDPTSQSSVNQSSDISDLHSSWAASEDNAVTSFKSRIVVLDNAVYYINGKKLIIASLDGEEIFAESELDENAEYCEILDDGEYVYVIGVRNEDSIASLTANGVENKLEITVPKTFVEVYDDGNNGALIETYIQSGIYSAAQARDKGIVIATRFVDENPYPMQGEDDIRRYVPSAGFEGREKSIAAEDILLPDALDNSGYGVLSLVWAEEMQISTKTMAVLGYSYLSFLDSETAVFTSYDSKRALEVSFGEDNSGTVAWGTHEGESEFIDFARSENGTLAAVTENNKLYIKNASSVSISGATKSQAYSLVSGNDVFYIFTEDDKAYMYQIESGEITKCESDNMIFFKEVTDTASVSVSSDSKGTHISFTSNIGKDGSNSLSEQFISPDTNEETQITSAAAENSGALLVSGSSVYIPCEYFDGIDYCISFEKYTLQNDEFIFAGSAQLHESDLSGRFIDGAVKGDTLYAATDERIIIIDTKTMQITASVPESDMNTAH